MNRLRSLAWVNLIAVILQAGLAYATNFNLFNKSDVGQVSDQYNSLFTPAGITFSIWGVIYLSLIAFGIFHLINSYRQSASHQANIDLSRIDVWFLLNNIVTIAWLIFWTQGLIFISLVLIFIQLITLVIIHLRVGIHDPHTNASSKIFTHFPLSIYLAWISIATIANASIYLLSINWNGFGLGYTDISWTRIMIVVAIVITALVILTRRNVFFGLVVMWAFYGIILKRREVNDDNFSDINLIAWTGIIVIGLLTLLQLVRNLAKPKRASHPVFPASHQAIK